MEVLKGFGDISLGNFLLSIVLMNTVQAGNPARLPKHRGKSGPSVRAIGESDKPKFANEVRDVVDNILTQPLQIHDEGEVDVVRVDLKDKRGDMFGLICIAQEAVVSYNQWYCPD